MSTVAHAEEYTLTGDIGIQGGEVFTFKVVLRDSINGYMTGEAFTFSTPGKDVKSKIIAQIDRQSKKLKINEQHIIYNHGFKSKTIFCLIESQLEYNAIEKILAGKLTSRTDLLGASCAQGSITFSRVEEIEALFKSIQSNTIAKNEPVSSRDTLPAIKKPVISKIIYDTLQKNNAELKPVPELPYATITAGIDKTIYVENTNIIIEIWDGNKVDNDRIDVNLNGEFLLRNYTISNNKKTLHISINKNLTNTLTITALNNGSEPPNTVNLRIVDGTSSHDIIAHNDAGKASILKIALKK